MVNHFSVVRGELPCGPLTGLSSFATTSEPSQQASAQEPSLAEKARELRAKTPSEGKKPTKVYTSDDIARGGGSISILGGGPSVSAPSAPSEAGAKRDEHYYRQTMTELQDRLDLRRRELEVLQQKLSLQQQVEAKTKEVKADEQAIADLQAQLRRDGGDAHWLRPGPRGQTENQVAEQPGEAGECESQARNQRVLARPVQVCAREAGQGT